MKPRTLRKCIRKAKAFAYQYGDHPKFYGYTEDEIAKGRAAALAAVKEYRNFRHAGCLPVPDSEVIRIFDACGIDKAEGQEFSRLMEVYLILLGLFNTDKDNQEFRAEDSTPPSLDQIEDKVLGAGADIQDFIQQLDDSGIVATNEHRQEAAQKTVTYESMAQKIHYVADKIGMKPNDTAKMVVDVAFKADNKEGGDPP